MYTTTSQVFAAETSNGLFSILMRDDGSAVTRMDLNAYDAISGECVRYEQPRGITLTAAEIAANGIKTESEINE